jgi:hypothetical protein
MRVYEFGTTEEEDEEDEFFKSTVSALNQLGSKKFGGAMIGAMQNSDLRFGISQGKNNKATPNFNDPNRSLSADGGIMTGANMTWDVNDDFILGHELAHGWDIMNGYDTSWADDNKDPFYNMYAGEVRASHMENIMRAENGVKLNTVYGGVELVKNRKELQYGYDYSRNNLSKIPWVYGSDRGANPNPLRDRRIQSINPQLQHQRNPIKLPRK